MLILQRDVGESIEIGRAGDVLDRPIVVKLGVSHGRTTLCVDAPANVIVDRSEVVEDKRLNGLRPKRAAASQSSNVVGG